MANIWQADEDVMNTIRDLIANYHPHLASVDKEILVIFREKAGKSGDVITSGKSRKAPPLLGVVTETDWKFVLEIANDEWQSYSDPQRVALLDHLLCACKVDEDPETQVLKTAVVPPDVSFYVDEIARHGYWRVKGSPKQDDLITELFGPNASKAI